MNIYLSNRVSIPIMVLGYYNYDMVSEIFRPQMIRQHMDEIKYDNVLIIRI